MLLQKLSSSDFRKKTTRSSEFKEGHTRQTKSQKVNCLKNQNPSESLFLQKWSVTFLSAPPRLTAWLTFSRCSMTVQLIQVFSIMTPWWLALEWPSLMTATTVFVRHMLKKDSPVHSFQYKLHENRNRYLNNIENVSLKFSVNLCLV